MVVRFIDKSGRTVARKGTGLKRGATRCGGYSGSGGMRLQRIFFVCGMQFARLFFGYLV